MSDKSKIINLRYENTEKSFPTTEIETFLKLLETLKTSFNIPEDILKELQIIYFDEDGDEIAISGDEDFRTFLSTCLNEKQNIIEAKLGKKEDRLSIDACRSASVFEKQQPVLEESVNQLEISNSILNVNQEVNTTKTAMVLSNSNNEGILEGINEINNIAVRNLENENKKKENK